jgi:DNA-binding response OmpR family regulator
MMPGLHGVQMLTSVRERFDIPVIMLTAAYDQERLMKILEIPTVIQHNGISFSH